MSEQSGKRIVYLGIEIQIHGLEIDLKDFEAASNFLCTSLKEATKACLLGKQDYRSLLFNFRDEFDDDVTVEVFEHAGPKLEQGVIDEAATERAVNAGLDTVIYKNKDVL